jgi:hypothetical protein
VSELASWPIGAAMRPVDRKTVTASRASPTSSATDNVPRIEVFLTIVIRVIRGFRARWMEGR